MALSPGHHDAYIVDWCPFLQTFKIKSVKKNMLALAIAITAEGFKNTVDKGGQPYILHCLWVMRALHSKDEELNCIAVMHDNIEDGVCTLEELVTYGFSSRVLTALALLTHYKSSDYMEYIKALAHNPDCLKVKLADLKHNSDITRIKGLAKSDFDRMQKYHTAFTYLS